MNSLHHSRAAVFTLWITSVLATLFASPTDAAVSDLQISEFLASNDAGLTDEDGDNSDWIEIHNSGTTSVSLLGLTLTDDAAEPAQWTFPAVDLAADDYLIVFADSKDRAVVGSELHTNFKLGAGGEYLGLLDAAGTVIYEYAEEYPPQDEDRSYGINSNGDIRYFSTPTPGGRNGAGDVPITDPPSASLERGFYTTPITVDLTSATVGAVIRYTLDGSDPRETSSSIVYTAALSITTTTVVRAATYAAGYLTEATTTHTYIFLDDVITQPATVPGFPNGETRDAGYFDVDLDMAMDPAVVAEYSSEMITAMTSIPTMSITADIDDIFGSDGFMFGEDDVERKVSMEVLYPSDPDANEQIDAGAEAHSHDYLKRSMRVNFRSEYGLKEWDTKFFEDYTPVNGASAKKKTKTIVLRAGNNRGWARTWHPDVTSYTTDQFYRDSYIAMTGAGSHGAYVHLYLNGVYWGLYNPVERPDDDWAASYFDGDDDDWFYTNHGGSGNADSTRWDYLTETLVARDMRDAANYAEMQEYLNLEQYVDYIILAFWIGLTDWPENNWYFVMRNDASPLGPTPGQFVTWDGELSLDQKFGRASDTIARIRPRFIENNGADDPILMLWHALIESSDFRSLFNSRVDFHTATGGALSDAAAIERWDAIAATIDSAIIGESARWGDALSDIGELNKPENEWLNDRSVYEMTRTRDNTFRPQVAKVRAMMDGNTALFFDELLEAGFYGDVVVIEPNGGDVEVGSTVTLSNPMGPGSIMYTLDGSDPRINGIAYTGPISITGPVLVTAAIIGGSTVSVPFSAVFTTGATFVVSELHYNPSASTAAEIAAGFPENGQFEFIEFMNVSPDTLNLADMFLTAGIASNPYSMNVLPGQVFILVRDVDAFLFRYGTGPLIAGTFIGSLSNGGEQIVVEFPAGVPIVDFTYDDRELWPSSPDGTGPSLELDYFGPDINYSDASNWRVSQDGGSPGIVQGAPTYTPLTFPTVAPNVFSVDTPTIAPSLDDGFTYILTDYIEENGRVECEPRSSAVVSGFGCTGGYCDDVRLYCRTGGPSFVEVDTYTTDTISEETEPALCNANYFMTGVSCFGFYCDDLELQCTLSEGRLSDGTDCRWSDWVSEEDGGTIVFGDGLAARGMECRGGYCDDKRFWICPVVTGTLSPATTTMPTKAPVAAPTLAPVALPPSVSTLTYTLTSFATGNDEVECESVSNALVSGMSCAGGYCDDVRLLCRDGVVEYSTSTSYWSPDVSEETEPVVCDDDHFVSGIACSGYFCDNVSLQCTESVGRTAGTDCEWTEWVSEEGTGNLFFSDTALYVRGMECRGAYCDDKRLWVCPVIE